MNDTAARFLELVSGRKRGLGAALQRAGLRVASWVYGCGVWLRNRLYDWGWKRIEAASVSVISVGNLTVGGTGKTPCVEYVARFLSDRGHRVAILSRGYGAGDGIADEALVLEENLPDVPHLLGADRAELARTAIEELESDVLVLDDGFQHRRLARALDLVLIDATQPWGYGHLLPRGLLRESPRELKRAHAVILTRCDLVEESQLAAIRNRVARVAPKLPVLETEHRPLAWRDANGREMPVENMQGVAAGAFCGIGNAGAFFETLHRVGVSIRERREYADHHRYTRADVDDLERWAEGLPADAVLLTTQKDLVKLRIAALAGRPLWALRIGVRFRAGEERLHQLLESAMS